MSDKETEIVLSSTNEGQLVQFNLDDVKGKVADQMRAFLLNMMPAKAFNEVIELAFKKLTEPRPVLDYQGKLDRANPYQPSELEEMVIVEMKGQLSEKVREWGKRWKETPAAERARDKLMKDMIDRAAGSFMTQVSASIINGAIDAMASATKTVKCSSCSNLAPKGASCMQCGNYNY